MSLATGYAETHHHTRGLERASARSEREDCQQAEILALRAEIEKLKKQKYKNIVVDIYNNEGKFMHSIDTSFLQIDRKSDGLLDVQIYQK